MKDLILLILGIAFAVVVLALILLFPLFLINFFLERSHARQEHRAPRLTWLTLVFYLGLVVGLVGTFYINLTRIGHSSSSEAKMNLGAIYTGQRSYHDEHQVYGRTFEEIWWAPEGQNRYSYYLGTDFVPCKRRCTEELLRPMGETWPWPVRPKVTDDAFVAMAMANLDQDPALDVWMIDEGKHLEHLYDDEREENPPGVEDGWPWWRKAYLALVRTPEKTLKTFSFLVVIGFPLLVVSAIRDYRRYRK